MKHTSDILIIGGGIIGCAIAYNLRLRGRDVTVLERGEIGSQASGAAAGLLAPLGPLSGPGPFADLLLTSFGLFPTLVPELEKLTGMDLDYQQTGSLRTVRNSKRIPHLQKRMQAWQPLGLHMHWLTGDEARKHEPLLAPDICAAIYVPEEAQIRASRLVEAFAQAAIKRGARIHKHTEVTGIQINHTHATGVQLAHDELITCNHLIITTGAWASICGDWLQVTLPVQPQRGQMLAFQQASPALQHIIFGEAAYLAPKGESIFVGATKDEAGFDTQVTHEGISWLHTTAARLAPVLEHSSIETTWAGLRPRTPDGRPILGPVPQYQNITLAIGHNSVGVILSAITGQAIAEAIISGDVPAIIRPFSLERFTHGSRES